MEFRQIEYFLQLFKLRNMTKASRELFISQQGLSRSIKNLEDELGLSLFEKSQRGAFPTSEGEVLKPYFEALIQDKALLLSRAEKLKRQKDQPPISIACSNSLLYTQLPEMLRNFESLYPDTVFQINAMTEEQLLSALNADLCRFAFIQIPLPIRLTSHGTFLKENFAAVMSPDHPLAQQPTFQWSQASKQRLAMGDPSSTNTERLKLLLDKYHVIPESIDFYENIIVHLPELLARQIVCILPPSVMNCFNASLYVLKPIQPNFLCEIHLVSRQDLPLNPTEKKFVDSLMHQLNHQMI